MNFPTLKENEFTVLMANGETGIVLDINFNVYQNNNENQHVYSIFDNIQEAREFINGISGEYDKIEFIIYNSKQEVVEFIKAKFSS
ncbi:hypothetical protein CHRY9390_01349 [Chryseobacterium aquaeductus]|uniref:Uncharacterized protein n=1 Tax=Chryseobacterium aquaeductus TaxID=2675056 RepID=A0A9N8MGD9_9FLAO|nr:hypothetical protein [Chryseobacterium aquaeductus]CAA7330678.1 hypothetical protein CHRY9390_01349 [Chryseobacterium potabilaquae]CAD7805318.1 hypothetical protein CHRY9390_01349 [Chryseobacterium aquaeductus]